MEAEARYKKVAEEIPIFDPSNICDCVVYEKGKLDGIKEVVEFTRMLITQLDSQHGFIKRLEASPDWQAKLKEWGINP